MNLEMSLLDYDGRINKNVDYEIKENRSGINLKGFTITAEEMLEITEESIMDGTIEFTVERVIQYKPWNYGHISPGSGQLGVYELKASNGKTYFALIKDYRASEGDWRIALELIRKTESDMKQELQVNSLGFSFMDYLFPV